jgi:predicted GNAT family acetyltransferase
MTTSSWPEQSPADAITPPQISVVDEYERHRFEIVSGGQFAGYTEYRDLPYGRAFIHTVIDPHFEGHGLGSQLIRAALDEARAAKRNVIPLCRFVRRYIKNHGSYLDLVADRKHFGLDLPADDGSLQHG